MRFVIKKEEDKTEKLASEQTYLSLLEIVRTGNKGLIKDTIYRDSYETPDGIRSRVEDQLAIAYKNKCAYCERLCKADIEHYRPKKGVDGARGHSGYYWLCYEWTNLIPACITCNREGSKHNQFPILGERVLYPPLLFNNQLALEACKAGNSPLLDERPCLLHPEIDHPEDFFGFETDSNGAGIRLVGIDAEGRGTCTIQTCLLNRQELMLDRKINVVDEFRDAVEGLFYQLQCGELSVVDFEQGIIQQLRVLKVKSTNPEKTHTYLRKFIVASAENFERIVFPFLEPKVREIVIEAFKTLMQ